MTERDRNPTAVCRRFETDLYHFQAGELPDDRMEQLAAHAESCPPCGRRLAVEEALLRGVKGRLERAPLPPELRVRVREALEAQAAPRGLAGWLRAPWLVPAAAALLLAALMLPVMPRLATVVQVDREVVVVDFDCERAGKTIEEQRRCTHPRHLNALRLAADRYWHLGLDRPAGREVASDSELRGHRLRVTGELDERSRTLHLSGFSDEGRAPLAAGLLVGALPGR